MCGPLFTLTISFPFFRRQKFWLPPLSFSILSERERERRATLQRPRRSSSSSSSCQTALLSLPGPFTKLGKSLPRLRRILLLLSALTLLPKEGGRETDGWMTRDAFWTRSSSSSPPYSPRSPLASVDGKGLTFTNLAQTYIWQLARTKSYFIAINTALQYVLDGFHKHFDEKTTLKVQTSPSERRRKQE